MQLGDGRVSDICLCGFHGYAPIRGFVVFTLYAGWQGIGFMVSSTRYAITHIGGLCFVEFFSSMDHGGSWKCFRVLKIGFVSSISFLGVRLVSGVFGCLTEIYIS